MSSRYRQKRRGQANGKLRRISVPKKGQRREYHSFLKNGLFMLSTQLIVYYSVGWWKGVCVCVCAV